MMQENEKNRITNRHLAHTVALRAKHWHDMAAAMANPVDRDAMHRYAEAVGSQALLKIMSQREAGVVAINQMKRSVDKLIEEGKPGEFAPWPSGHWMLPGGETVRIALHEYLGTEPPVLPERTELEKTQLVSPKGLLLTEVLEGRDLSAGYEGSITYSIQKLPADSQAA